MIITSVTPYPGRRRRLQQVPRRGSGLQVGGRQGLRQGRRRRLDDLFKAASTIWSSSRVEKNIKIINISHGLQVLGLPGESASLRDKVNSIVNNGIVVVAAAGNSAASDDFELYRRMADPAAGGHGHHRRRHATMRTPDGILDLRILQPRTNVGEDFKPDLIAPGGSLLLHGHHVGGQRHVGRPRHGQGARRLRQASGHLLLRALRRRLRGPGDRRHGETGHHVELRFRRAAEVREDAALRHGQRDQRQQRGQGQGLQSRR